MNFPKGTGGRKENAQTSLQGELHRASLPREGQEQEGQEQKGLGGFAEQGTLSLLLFPHLCPVLVPLKV